MLDKNTMIKVVNRNFGRVGYTIPDLNNLRRIFAPGEEKELTMEELRKLTYVPGGRSIIENFLIIENEEAVTELLGKQEPEYHYTQTEVDKILLEGTLDQLLDCLDFAPHGVIELVKKRAVDLELNDLKKREAIHKKTDFDVSKAIAMNQEVAGLKEETETKTARRAAPISEESADGEEVPKRRAPKYKVTTKVE